MRAMVGSHQTTIISGQKRIVDRYFNFKGLVDFIALTARERSLFLQIHTHTHSTTCDMKTVDKSFHMQKGDEKFNLWKQNQGNTITICFHMHKHIAHCVPWPQSIEKKSYKGNTVTMCICIQDGMTD